MKTKEVREELEQQLRALALERRNTLDSLSVVAETRKRKKVYELLQLQEQQQEELQRELQRVQEKEQRLTAPQKVPSPKIRIAAGIGFLVMMILFIAAIFQYNYSSSPTGLSVGEIPTVAVQDKEDKEVGSNIIELREDGKYKVEIHIPDEVSSSGTSVAQAPAQEVSVIMEEAEIIQNMVSVKADYYIGTPPERGKLKTKAVSVEGVGKVKATIHLPKLAKSGNVNTLFRCDDFDQDKFDCDVWKATDIPFTDDGKEIVFMVDHFSAYVAGEIVAIDAVHLDSGYNFISNIFDQIKAVDDIWSEPIAEGEMVRVTFERNLTEGRVIDIFIRSETMDAYVEVYEAGTNNLVGSSTLILSPDWKYITVGGLSRPMDVFDLRITSEDPQARVEFDYIHDDIIGNTQADGMVVWGGANNASPEYRVWNESNNLTPIARGQGIGTNGTEYITLLILEASWKRDEMILGTMDALNDTNIQVYNNSNTGSKFDTPLELSIDSSRGPNQARSFDIAYEDLSGDALIVYENTSIVDRYVSFVQWNGTRFSVPDNITWEDPTSGGRGLGDSAVKSVVMSPQPKGDYIMVMIHNGTNGLYAIPWNGTLFERENALVLVNNSANTMRSFDFAWEGLTREEGVAVYGDRLGQLFLRTYSTSSGWDNAIQVSFVSSTGIGELDLCADPNTDYIGMIFGSGSTNVSMWNGLEILSGAPLRDGATLAGGINRKNFHCNWFNSTHALFTFTDNVAAGGAKGMDYFLFTQPNNWNTSDLTVTASTYNFSQGVINSIVSVLHPSTGEIMFTTAGGAGEGQNGSIIRWNGSTFLSVAESPLVYKLNNTDGPNERIVFDWFRYDPLPNVTTMVPTLNSVFTANDLIDIGGNVTDNLFLAPAPMYLNITYPNGSNFTYTVSNTTGAVTKFNVTFSTAVTGVFTITFLANDSRNSLNYTEKTNFTVNAAAGGGGPLPLLISADIINLSSGTSSQGGGLVISSTSNGFTNGTSLSASSVGASGLSVVNISSGIININVSLLRNATHGNYPNVTFAWVLGKSNGSTMLNTTIQNNTFNQSAFNYSFNANLLPDGIYNLSVFVENISEGATRIVNYSRGFDIAIDRTPPNVTLTVMNTSNATNYRVGTTTEIQINVTLNDSATSVPVVLFGIFSVGNGTEFNVTPTKQGSYWFINLALGPLASGNHIVRLYGNDTLGNLNNSVSNLSFTLNLPPTPPVTGMPANDSAITNRTPIFDWFNSSDADGDVISYHIQVDDNARFTAPEINVSSIQDLSSAAPGNTTWYSSIELAVDTRFYWRVRANDSFGYGNWSNGATVDGPTDAQNNSNFTVSSLLSITMTNSGIDFGTVTPGTEVGTSDGDPIPFRAENTGNIDANVTVNGSRLYTNTPINRSAYQFQIRANESNAFSTALSSTSWTNMTNSTTAAHVVNLTWRNARNDFLVDLNLTIPSDEPSGFKNGNVTFTLTRNE